MRKKLENAANAAKDLQARVPGAIKSATHAATQSAAQAAKDLKAKVPNVAGDAAPKVTSALMSAAKAARTKNVEVKNPSKSHDIKLAKNTSKKLIQFQAIIDDEELKDKLKIIGLEDGFEKTINSKDIEDNDKIGLLISILIRFFEKIPLVFNEDFESVDNSVLEKWVDDDSLKVKVKNFLNKLEEKIESAKKDIKNILLNGNMVIFFHGVRSDFSQKSSGFASRLGGPDKLVENIKFFNQLCKLIHEHLKVHIEQFSETDQFVKNMLGNGRLFSYIKDLAIIKQMDQIAELSGSEMHQIGLNYMSGSSEFSDPSSSQLVLPVEGESSSSANLRQVSNEVEDTGPNAQLNAQSDVPALALPSSSESLTASSPAVLIDALNKPKKDIKFGLYVAAAVMGGVLGVAALLVVLKFLAPVAALFAVLQLSGIVLPKIAVYSSLVLGVTLFAVGVNGAVRCDKKPIKAL